MKWSIPDGAPAGSPCHWHGAWHGAFVFPSPGESFTSGAPRGASVPSCQSTSAHFTLAVLKSLLAQALRRFPSHFRLAEWWSSPSYIEQCTRATLDQGSTVFSGRPLTVNSGKLFCRALVPAEVTLVFHTDRYLRFFRPASWSRPVSVTRVSSRLRRSR